MRIAMLTWESRYSVAVGGVAAHVSDIAMALSRRGHEVHVFTRQAENQARRELIDGVHYHRCPYQGLPDLPDDVERMNDSFIWHLVEYEKEVDREFDVIHGHDWLCTRGIVRAKNHLARPAVLTMHSTEFGRCGNQFFNGGTSQRVRDLEWEGLYVADQVIAVSASLRGEVHWIYRTPEWKTRVIYNGVHVRKFDADVDVPALRGRYAIGVGQPMVLFAGRLTWQKGPDLLLEAIPGLAAHHGDARFVFAGDGDMRGHLEGRAQYLGVAPATRFLGHRNGSEIVGLFKAADIVCVPSRNEPFGIVILEAWGAGKPVIATCNGGPVEFVQHQETGLTVFDSPDSIGWGIGTALADLNDARRMGRNGRLVAETRFAWEKIAAETERVYQQVARREPGGQRAFVPDREVAMQTTGNGKGRRGKTATTDITTSPKVTSEASGEYQPTPEEIRLRAYQIFSARKGATGDPTADWLQAEQELREENKRTRMPVRV
ncbi:MAG: glycosyltransferase [Phycisphaerae bacterium]